MRRFLVLLSAVALVVVACGGTPTIPGGSVAVRANAELAVGQERLLVGIVGPEGVRIGDPQTPIRLELRSDATGGEPIVVATDFIWIVPNAFGIYKADIAFGEAGTWSAVAVADDGSRTDELQFSVLAESSAPGVGDQAPRIATPTSTDFEIAAISTDPNPDPRFYELSLDEALDNGRPTVVVFATPRFCQTSACGPLLDQVKAIATRRSDVDYVHVEIFERFDDPSFDPSDPAFLAPAVRPDGYNLVSEPWVFVTDEDGVITARFEGVASDDELEVALS